MTYFAGAHNDFVEGVKTALQNLNAYSIIKRAALVENYLPTIKKITKTDKMQIPAAPKIKITTPLENPTTRKKI